jgi:O-antigen chain-terminating methyltransferase
MARWPTTQPARRPYLNLESRMSRMPSLDDIIQATRQEATRPEYQLGNVQALLPPQVLSSAASTDPSKAEPPSVARAKHFDELLLEADPERFVERAYQTILGRSADAAGAQQYLQKLSQGYGQSFVIAGLLASGEARTAAAPLAGRGLSAWPYNAWRVGRRLGLAGPTRLLNLAYSVWRHALLAASGKLLAFTQSSQQQAVQRLRLEQQKNHQDLAQQQALALSKQNARLDEQHAQQLDSLATLQKLQKQAVDQTRELQLIKARLTVLQQQTLPPVVQGEWVPEPLSSHDPVALEARVDAYYLAFEEANRGTQAEIATKLSVYLAPISRIPESLRALPMLDIGCGRGEWIELLMQQGFEARGIDQSPQMVQLCRSKGLKVEVADALAWLASQPDQSHALISGFHIVEHLPFAVLFQIMEHAWRVLAPGGLLIFETPNPENALVGSHTFYHDPTHRNPMTPTAMNFMLAYHGFENIQTLRLHPYPASDRVQESSLTAERLNGHLYGPQDFAVVGTRPTPDADAGADA